MIVEMRTYVLKPGAVNAVEGKYAQVLPERTKLSPLGGFWHTEIGTLNSVIQLWQYEGADERESVRAQAAKTDYWPPRITEYLVEQETRLLTPAPFSPPLGPRQLGKLYEFRTYQFPPGSMPQVLAKWGKVIEERIAHSPLVAALYAETGALNQFVHVWAYDSWDERIRIRAAAAASGNWPPRGDPALLRAETILAFPASFSPLN